jgi:hypothetical protein
MENMGIMDYMVNGIEMEQLPVIVQAINLSSQFVTETFTTG